MALQRSLSCNSHPSLTTGRAGWGGWELESSNIWKAICSLSLAQMSSKGDKAKSRRGRLPMATSHHIFNEGLGKGKPATQYHFLGSKGGRSDTSPPVCELPRGIWWSIVESTTLCDSAHLSHEVPHSY